PTRDPLPRVLAARQNGLGKCVQERPRSQPLYHQGSSPSRIVPSIASSNEHARRGKSSFLGYSRILAAPSSDNRRPDRQIPVVAGAAVWLPQRQRDALQPFAEHTVNLLRA